ncbi:MAG TPA: HNH endonuclease signature motif containing protein [Candidatus Micrarchaeia archaeon]|nr:HNH endonuclease signature motif containing protein [Candidatus Micrarchaeia archaeon]
MSVLLLNASLQPLNVISRRRLVVLLTRERVAFFDESARAAVEADLARRCLGEGVIVVRLLRNISVPRRLLRPNRRNLLVRDDFSCQYCGWQGSAMELTIDHVVPVSRGGAPSTWENQVVACRRCNSRKANHLAAEVHLHLRRAARPVAHEYAHLLFLRHPEVRPAYEALLQSTLLQTPPAAPPAALRTALPA